MNRYLYNNMKMKLVNETRVFSVPLVEPIYTMRSSYYYINCYMISI